MRFRDRTAFLALAVLTLGLAACQMPITDPAKKETAQIQVFLGAEQGTGLANRGTFPTNNAVLGTPSTTPIVIKNTGKAKLTLKAPTLSGPDAALFAVTKAPLTSLAPGAQTTLELTFTPTEAAAGRTVTLTLESNSAKEGTFVLTLTADATALPSPALAVSVAATAVTNGGTIDLGSSALGTATAATVTITNMGTAAATDVTTSLLGSADFAVTTAPAITLAVGASTTLTVSMTPARTAAGPRTSTLTVACDGATFSASLTGIGTIQSKVYYLTIPGSPLTAAQHAAQFADGTFLLFNSFGKTSNSFYFTSPNYYGSAAPSFLMFPTPMSGDFSISASILDAPLNASNPSGIAIGMTSGFQATDKYAYALMTNNKAITPVFVSAANTVTMATTTGTPEGFTAGSVLSFLRGTSTLTNNNGILSGDISPVDNSDVKNPLASAPVNMNFTRVGNTLSMGATSGTLATLTAATVTDGTTVYGTAPMYPSLSFVRTHAKVTNLVIKDGDGNVVFDSTYGGSMGTYYPAAVNVTASAANTNVGSSTSVVATASTASYDVPGSVASVTAISSNTAVATVAVTNNATDSTVTITGVTPGTATITVTHGNDATKTKTIAVTITSFPTTDPYGSLAAVASPVPGASAAFTDGELALTFDAPPALVTGGLIKILKASDGSEVDNIAFTGEVQNVPTSATTATPINVGNQLVRISGNTLFITPHFGKLVYNTQYYVAIPNNAITGTLGGVAFEGLSADKAVATWNFTTRSAPTLDAANITVDGSSNSTANFRTLGGALMALTQNPLSASNLTINVAAGTYTELVQYRPTTANLAQTITIKGPVGNSRGNNCIIQYTNGGTMNATQQMRASFYFAGANLVLQNVTLKNTGVRATVSQAEALYFDSRVGSTLAATNCSFVSNQDTINTTGRTWLYNCFIQGNTDFIWGTADAALIEACDLRVYNDGGNLSSPFPLIVARTNGLKADNTYQTGSLSGFTGTVGKGYVLMNSTVSVDDGCTAVFGRDAGTGNFYDQVALINNTFSASGLPNGASSGTIGAGMWVTTTAPLSLGDSTFVGWKAVGNTGLNLASLTADPKTATAIADQATEYATRDQILNRVVTVVSGAPTGYQATPLGNWDVSALASAFGAP